MGLHKHYLKVGQSAKNKLFGITPQMRKDNQSMPLNMLISQQGKINHGRLAVIMFGLFTLALGIILSFVPWLDYIIFRDLRLWNGSISYSYWQKPGVVRLTRVYIFNVSNPQGFLDHGEKPRLTEIGPFVYREDMEKVNIKFHDNDTVTYQHNKILRFVPEMSVDKYQRLVVPNIPLLTLTTHSNYLNFLLQKAVQVGVAFSKQEPFVKVTADELVFGYDDPLVSLAHTFYPRHKRPMSKMGLLLARNGTLNEVSTIYTGHETMDRFGYLDKVNGLDHLPYWRDKPCTDIRASEGSFFPPRHVTKSDIVQLYDKDLCRILPLKYRKGVVKDGIKADLYTPPSNVFQTVDKMPDNKCYCPGSEYCPPKGLQNISPCQYDAPVYLSFPHFYDADPSLKEPFEGLKPNKKRHETYFMIQPKLGVPVEGQVRVQLNLKVERASNIASVSKFPDIIYPIMWLEEGIDELTPSIWRWIYLATTIGEVAAPLLTYSMIVVGLLVLIVVFVRTYKSFVFSQDSIEIMEIGRETLRRGSTLLVNGSHRLLAVKDTSYTLLNSTPSTPSPSREFPNRNAEDFDDFKNDDPFARINESIRRRDSYLRVVDSFAGADENVIRNEEPYLRMNSFSRAESLMRANNSYLRVDDSFLTSDDFIRSNSFVRTGVRYRPDESGSDDNSRSDSTCTKSDSVRLDDSDENDLVI